jgi:hypothetical protein
MEKTGVREVREALMETFIEEAVSLYWRDFWELLGTLFVIHGVKEVKAVIDYLGKLIENPEMDRELIEYWLKTASEKGYSVNPLSMASKLKRKLEGRKVYFRL